VELSGHLPTGRVFHRYINPGREMPEEARAVHGLDDAFLADKPPFGAVAADFTDFIGDAPLVIHNAAFDLKFLNHELALCGCPALPDARAVDTLAIARRRFPGAQNSLDALCRRFGIDNSARDRHGALLDAELLAEVYLDLIGGRQQGLSLEADTADASGGRADTAPARPRPVPLAPRITAAEAEAHEAFVAGLGEAALWLARRDEVS